MRELINLTNKITNKVTSKVTSKKTRKRISKIILSCLMLVMAIAVAACTKEEDPKAVFEKYKTAWEAQDFSSMYSMLAKETKDKITEEEFTARYKNIYSGIEAANIGIKPEYPQELKADKENKVEFPFSATMDTGIGNVNVTGYEGIMVQEKVEKKKEWKILWSEKMIFPAMEEGDVVRYSTNLAVRGTIKDRNGKDIAANGQIAVIGINPKGFEANRSASVQEMARILDIKAEDIEKKLQTIKNQDDFFPLVKMQFSDLEKFNSVISLTGVQYKKETARVYGGGEALGRLVGYVDEISAEELTKYKGKGYSRGSKIGKAGLEQVYEDRLRGENGGEIYIATKKDNKETKKSTIIKKEPKQGEDIKLSIDMDLQVKIYEQMKGDAGASTAVNPITGEILALVSSPSYDSNVRSKSVYESETYKAAYKANEKSINTNRFSSTYAPGSTFKLITGAIGLKTGVTKPEETEDIKGLQWQPDKSWGTNYITRVSDPGKPVDLKTAYVISDNIYFAKQALKIGKEKMISESKAFGFGEALPIDYPITKSQIANGDKISSDGLLANTGYGQGEVLMSPLHVNLIYSSLLTKGNIMTPVLEVKNGETLTPKVWKENAIPEENAKILLGDLTAVVEEKAGTGYEPPYPGLKIAGKTGTAEINKTKQGESGQELGWFVGMNTDNPRLTLLMMIEDVHGRGGSHYVVPKVKKVMDEYLKK